MSTLVLNAGSSSVKYAVFAGDVAIHRGQIDRADGVHEVLDRIADPPTAVGHRLVHGGPDHTAPTLVDDAVLATLTRAIELAPLHLPVELAALEAVRQRFHDMPQVACFDTAFHRTMPAIAHRFALPAALCDAGVRRYGFHGLSYEYIASVVATTRRAVFAHLGNGASMVAVRDGISIDTTMGFSPSGGLVMGTRSGDLDPGVLLYLLDHGYDRHGLRSLVEYNAGLTALSGGTSDMRQLLAARAHDSRATLAIDVFCYQARKWIGALAAALGGLDTLVFAGGIGEHAPVIRAQICEGLGHLGIELDRNRNDDNAAVIGGGRCDVRIVKTDEEAVIARHTQALLSVN